MLGMPFQLCHDIIKIEIANKWMLKYDSWPNKS